MEKGWRYGDKFCIQRNDNYSCYRLISVSLVVQAASCDDQQVVLVASSREKQLCTDSTTVSPSWL